MSFWVYNPEKIAQFIEIAYFCKKSDVMNVKDKKNDLSLLVLSWLFSGISSVSWPLTTIYGGNKLIVIIPSIIALIITLIAIIHIIKNNYSSGTKFSRILLLLIPIIVIGGLVYFILYPIMDDIVISRKKAVIEQLNKDMVLVEGGSFYMGATDEQINEAFSDEKPAHEVSLPNYYICK